MMCVVVNSIALGVGRPELYEHGHLQKAPAKNSKPGRQVLVLGYAIPKLSGQSIPTGRKLKLHMRNGHYKMQRYGPGRTEIKTIFIDPYWAGI